MSWIQREPGRRILKEGMRGTDVVWLQEQLIQWGYALNGVDGHYGPLTAGAVKELQRDFKLRADGIAGPMVFSLLKSPPPFHIHTITQDVTLGSIARQWGIGIVGLKETNRRVTRAGLYRGRRLIIPCRHILTYGDPVGPRLLSRLTENAPQITGLLLPVSSGEKPKEELLRLALDQDLGVYLQLCIDEQFPLFVRWRRRKQLLQEISRLCHRTMARAVLVDSLSNPRFFIPSFLGRLRQVLNERQRQLMVTYTHRRKGPVFTGLAQGDWVVLQLPQEGSAPGLPPWSLLRAGILRLRQLVPPWRILLSLPLCGWRYDPDTQRTEPISHWEGLELLRKARSKPGFSEEFKAMEFSYGAVQVWLPTDSTLAHWLWLVNRYNLGGVVLTGVGLEDGRLWRNFKQHFLIHK